MEFTEFGMKTEERTLHPKKASFPIFFTELGIVIEESETQL